MPADVGTQTVTILYYRAANSSIVNKRFHEIRQVGLYKGGYLSIVDDANCQLSLLICEISDGTNQVRVETTVAVNIGVASATPYVVLRWTYTGAITDYMEILAVATPAANDIVVGLCTFDGSDDLNGFNYQHATYPRTTPNTQDLFLKVEATPASELRVQIRAGRVTTFNSSVDISDQLSTTLSAPVSNSRIDLIYVTTTGVIAVVTGTAAASPSVPDYGGKMVLAEITIASTDVNIAASAIKDVRNFLTPSISMLAPTMDFVEAGGRIDCPSTSFTDMTTMSLAFTVDYVGQPIKFEFHTTIWMRDNHFVYFAFTIDGSIVHRTTFQTGDDHGSGIAVSMLYADKTLAKGTYTLKVQWKESSSNTARTSEDTDFKRIMTITKF